MLAWKDKTGQREDKPMPGRNCKNCTNGCSLTQICIFSGKYREYSEAVASSDLRREYPGKIPRCNDTSGEA